MSSVSAWYEIDNAQFPDNKNFLQKDIQHTGI